MTALLLVMGILILVAARALRRPLEGSGLPSSADPGHRRKHSWWDWDAIRNHTSWGGPGGGGWGGCGGGGGCCGGGGGCCGGGGCGSC